MILLPSWWVPPGLLATVLLVDVALSTRPVHFIRDCLHGVRFPEEWWWDLLVVKALAAAGIITDIWIPGLAFAAKSGGSLSSCAQQHPASEQERQDRPSGSTAWGCCNCPASS